MLTRYQHASETTTRNSLVYSSMGLSDPKTSVHSLKGRLVVQSPLIIEVGAIAARSRDASSRWRLLGTASAVTRCVGSWLGTWVGLA